MPKMTFKDKLEAYHRFMEPYPHGRELNDKDKKILEHMVNAYLDILDEMYEMKDGEQIGRTQRLIDDMQTVIHVWKKADGAM